MTKIKKLVAMATLSTMVLSMGLLQGCGSGSGDKVTVDIFQYKVEAK